MYGKSGLFSYFVVASRYTLRFKSDSSKRLLEFLATMPKANSVRIAESQRQRQQITKKSEKYSPSTVYLQVLGSGARGVPNTLYMFTDQKRYLFNCGEGTQRLAHEHKVKLSRLEDVFITSKTWKNIGGLPGLSLTLQDVGVPNITLHGPEGLDELYNATRRFVIMKDMNVTMAKCSPSDDFEDNVMTVKYVLLGPEESLLEKDLKPAAKKQKLDNAQDKEYEEFIHDDTDYYKSDVRNSETHNNKNRNKPRPKSSPDPIRKKTEKVLLELQKKTHCTVAYICTLKKRFGTLDLAKCVELGVKPGPMLGQLKSGHDVVLPDGTLVMSKDVKTPDDPGPVFIILEVPDLSYLKEDEFSAHFHNGKNIPENIPTLIVHYTPPHVVHHPRYRSFMIMFGPTTQHLILNSQNTCLGSEAVHRTQHKLHLLDPDIFPLLRDISIPAVWTAQPPVPKTDSPIRLKGLEELKEKFQNIISMEGSCKGDGQTPMDDVEQKLEVLAGHTLTMFHLRPKKQIDRSAEPKLHVQEYLQETMDVNGFVDSLQQFRTLVDSVRYAKSDSQKEYPKVVFLGTGSCIPNKTRNTSAIVLQVNETKSILLDCGEGTFGQLVRFYGPKKVNGFLRTLKAVYISHLHADHHIGLIGVIQARRQAIEEISEQLQPLRLLAPGQIVSWLYKYDQQFEHIRHDFTLIPNQSLLHNRECPELTSAVLASMGVEQVRTCQVAHCPNAFGVAIQVDEHNKITYSGDTLPCEELIKLGENSSLLIHEATMEDELADEARIKMHSTTSQAIDIGKRMNARYTVLTHFSQRYARLPRLNSHILNDNTSVGIAFDNMQITMADLDLLPHMYAPLQLMFAEHCVEMELKAAHRARIKERRSSSPNVTSIERPGKVRGVNKTRSRSPVFRNIKSAPGSQANYRESYASRLRQEIKGMAVTGIVRQSRLKSSSPRKIYSIHQISELESHKPLRALPPKETIDVISTPSRTMSEASDISKHPSEQVRAIDYLSNIDTRSKTLSTVLSSPVCAEEPEVLSKMKSSSENLPLAGTVVLAHAKALSPVHHSATEDGVSVNHVMSSTKRKNSNGLVVVGGRKIPPNHLHTNNAINRERNTATGYGKPLFTPLNRRLKVMRDIPLHSEPVIIDKTVTISNRNSKSPTNSSKENNESFRAMNMRARDQSDSLKSTGNKLYCINTSLRAKTDSEIPILRCSGGTTPARVSSSSLKSGVSSTRTAISLDSRKPDSNISMRITRTENKVKSPSASSLKKNLQPTHPLRDPTRKSTSSLFNEKRTSRCNQLSIPVISRPNSSAYSNRSFKPQLEDIQSSFLLLNKKPQNRNIKASLDDERKVSKAPTVSKPKPLNEADRRQQLLEVRKKFQSRGFRNDSRYDKIEGLNWISWK